MIFFRVDSNNYIASGHVMRCIALAKTLKERGRDVKFLLADSNPISILKMYKMDYIVLKSDWKNLLSDVEKVIRILKNYKRPVLIVDTYKVTRQYIELVSRVSKVVYMGSKQEYLGEISMLINYSADIDYRFYEKTYSSNTRLLLGPEYAPLRSEFKNYNLVYKAKVERILITTGSTDLHNVVTKLLNILLNDANLSNIVFDVIIGSMNDNQKKIHELYDDSKFVTLHENVENMSSIMKNCDLAISANGTTVYELAAVGIPTISFAMVEEQVKSGEAMKNKGVVDYCGCLVKNEENCVSKICMRVQYYVNNNGDRIRLAKKAHEFIAGDGCEKIVYELERL